MDLKILIAATILATSGFMAVAYEQIADNNHWGVGSLYRLRNGLTIASLGVIIAFGAVLASVIKNPWWVCLVVFFVAATLARVFIGTFKGLSQAIVPIMMIISLPILLYFIYA